MRRQKLQVAIPHDLAVEIIVRLPVKSIFRCRCVCRAWNNLVFDPNFIARHRNLRNNEVTLMFNQYHKRLSWLSCSFEDDSEKILSVVTSTSAPSSRPYICDYTPQNTIASCNGLLCICEDGIRFTLWNPATREYKHLPFLSARPASSMLRLMTDQSLFGFGFDWKMDDYKVLKFTGVEYETRPGEYIGEQLVAMHYEIDLYSLKSNSWKMIQPFEDHHHYSLKCCTYNENDGICYWVGLKFDGDHTGTCIVSFDMTSENFQKIPLPESAKCVDLASELECVRLGTVDGCLALVISNVREIPSTYYNVWILSKDGENSYWFKQASMLCLSWRFRCLGFWTNDALHLVDGDDQLFLYDIGAQSLKVVKGIENYPLNLQFVSSFECIVPIYGIRGQNRYIT